VTTGKLISFEGLDGAGKTTQMGMLQAWLERQHIPFMRTREPGGTTLGAELRLLLLSRPELHITALAEAFLFQADRAQHFDELIVPALAEGKLVITDRCLDSSIAYQGAGRELGTELIEHLSLLATRGRVPDLTILLDLEPANVRTRTDGMDDPHGIRGQQTHFDSASELFHQRLRTTFLELARTYPERIKVINAAQPAEQVYAQILAFVQALLI
jgi:dTMP kinase